MARGTVLRFLAIALGADRVSGPDAVGASPGQPQPDSSRLIHVYERLLDIHPDDLQLRQNLQALLERGGRIDEAVKLAATTPPVTPMECSGPFGPQPVSVALQRAADAIRIRARVGEKDRALAETAKVAALAKREGIAAYLVAADLDLELSAPDRAVRLITQAAREARSREDQRQVAFARERASTRAGRTAELKTTYNEWKRSDDPCLRVAAMQRAQQGGAPAAGPQMSPPPSSAVTRGVSR